MRVERWVFSALMTSRAGCGRRIDIRDGWVAQLAEQWTENPRVGGSIPPPATSFLNPETYESFYLTSHNKSRQKS